MARPKKYRASAFIWYVNAMEALTLLAATLGLSALAGLNLYLTVFVTSLALQQGWLVLAPGLEPIAALNHPVIVAVSGLLYFIEFFADKVPWLDSMWDTIHTAIRPIGATLLGLTVLGDMPPVAEIMAALLCGSIALSTHLTKAGLRLVANTSPEPFSNIGLSLGEDAVVLGGLYSIYHYPLLTFAVGAALLAGALWLSPWIYRQVRATIGYIFGKLNAVSTPAPLEPLPIALPEKERLLVGKALGDKKERLEWAVPVRAGAFSGWRSNEPLYLVKTSTPDRLVLVSGRRQKIEDFSSDELELSSTAGFLYDELHFFFPPNRRGWTLRFSKNRRSALEAIQRHLKPSASVPPLVSV
jgi:hypothetical protein